MKIKEFSQKHSVSLFWTTIILLIVSIVLGSYMLCDNSPRRMKNFGGDFENKGMMQRGGQDGNGFRNFNRGNFQPDENQFEQNEQNQNQVAPQNVNSTTSANQ